MIIISLPNTRRSVHAELFTIPVSECTQGLTFSYFTFSTMSQPCIRSFFPTILDDAYAAQMLRDRMLFWLERSCWLNKLCDALVTAVNASKVSVEAPDDRASDRST